MLRVLAFALAMVIGQDLSQIVSQQDRLTAGLEMYRQKNYDAAAILLRAYAFDSDPDRADPNAQYALAVMYDRGVGVAADPVMACAFYDLARRATARAITPDRVLLETIATEAYDQRGCGGRNEHDKLEIGQLMSCFREWPTPVTFDLGAQGWVSIDRLDVTIHSGNEQASVPLLVGPCQAIVLPVTHERIGSRDFLHYFYWMSGGPDRGAHSVHALHWAAFEVRGTALKMVTDAELVQTTDMRMPSGELTPALRNLVKLETNASGEVEWTLATTPPRHGNAERR